MKNRIYYFFKSIGITSFTKNPELASCIHSDYNLFEKNDSEKINNHREFLKSVLEQENSRLGYIENKTSQIISQTSIVFSLLGLFVPIIIERFEATNIALKILIMIILLITFSLYLLSITNALKNFNITKFEYPYVNPANVIEFKDKTLEEFNSQLVRDYLHCIDKSVHINNEKGTNLLHSYKAFKLGNFSTGLIVMCICSMLLFTKSEDSKIYINNPIEIKNLDSLLKVNRVITISPKDTIVRKLIFSNPKIK